MSSKRRVINLVSLFFLLISATSKSLLIKIFAITRKKPFLFHCVCEDKIPNRVNLPHATK